MYGFEAISAHNGWAMAIIGPLIVMSGLAILSLIISQLHRLVDIIEHHTGKQREKNEQSGSEDMSKGVVPNQLPSDIHETAKLYQPLVEQLDQPFELHVLYELAQKNYYPHPYLTTTRLREAGILVGSEDGLFTWNLQSAN